MQRTRINHMIRISPIRLIGAEGEQVGVIDTAEAFRMAQEAGLDLVEISPDVRPPVCKIMDYGKFRYDKSKQSKNKGAKANELKEIRLGRSIKIDPHDVQIRVDQARRFLMAGHKVQLIQRFRGREMMHKQLGEERLLGIIHDLSDIAKVERAPLQQGRQMTVVLAPDKPRVEAVKRRLEKEGKQAEEDLAQLEREIAEQHAADDAAEAAEETTEDGIIESKKHRAKVDERIVNAIDDEIADLLGE